MICPCKNCEKKGCGPYHDECKAYQEWSQESRRVKERSRLASDEDYLGKPKKRW